MVKIVAILRLTDDFFSFRLNEKFSRLTKRLTFAGQYLRLTARIFFANLRLMVHPIETLVASPIQYL